MSKPEKSVFAELLARLERSTAEGEAQTHHKEITPAETVKHLMTGYALLQRVSDLKPGDIIRGVRELTQSHIRNWDHPHILIEILPQPLVLTIDHDGVSTNGTCKRYDCIIGFHIPTSDTRGSGCIIRHYADMREWELYPDAAKLKTHS